MGHKHGNVRSSQEGGSDMGALVNWDGVLILTVYHALMVCVAMYGNRATVAG